ncbi:MAG: HD domain-containing protein [Actinobacteria bacterium]|nr:HD domain-containing protein [Actinomycetota bacterium]
MHNVNMKQELSTSQLFEIGETFLQKFNSVIKHSNFYPENHPILVESISNFKQYLKEIFQSFGRLHINIYEGEVYLFNRFVPDLGKSFEKLVSFLETRKVNEISILPGITEREIYDFAKSLTEKPENIEKAGGLQTRISNLGITHISVTSSSPKKEEEREEEDNDFFGISEETYIQAVTVIKKIAFQYLSGMPLDVREARQVVDNLVEKVLQNPDALIRLSILKNYDEDTYYHSVNVMLLSLTLGASLGLEKPILSALGLASLLHDLGKVKIPQEIIKKATSLTRDEWEMMKKHTVFGAQALLLSPNLNKICAVVALEHHLNVDKTGYPSLPLVKKPHIFSRLVQITDVYDALTSQRPYRKPTLPDNALRLIFVQSKTKLDPVLAKQFVRLMGIYPVGSVVKLNTQEYAVVVKPGKDDITRPIVFVLLNEHMQKYEQPFRVNLLEEARKGGKRHSILEAVDPAKVGIDPKEYVVPHE